MTAAGNTSLKVCVYQQREQFMGSLNPFGTPWQAGSNHAGIIETDGSVSFSTFEDAEGEFEIGKVRGDHPYHAIGPRRGNSSRRARAVRYPVFSAIISIFMSHFPSFSRIIG